MWTKLSKAMVHRSPMLLFIIVVLVPILLGFLYAVAYSLGLVGVLSEGFSGRAWLAVWGDGRFYTSILYSLVIGAVVLLVSVLIALCIVLGLRSYHRFRWFDLVLYIPMSFPAMVVAFVVFLFFTQSGFWARFAYAAGLIEDISQFPSAVHDPFGAGVILAHVFLATSFFSVLFSGLYQRIRIDEKLAVSQNLGASRFFAIRSVAVPALLQASVSNLVMYFIFVVGSYEIPLLLGNQKNRMITLEAMHRFQHYDLGRISEGYVVALSFAAALLFVVFLLFRSLKRMSV